MEETNQEESDENKYRFGLKALLGWLVGLGSFIAGISFLAQGQIVSGLASLAIPFFSIPLLADKWQSKYGYELSTGMTALSVCLLFLLVGSVSPTPTTSDNNSDVEVQNGQVIVEDEGEAQNDTASTDATKESAETKDSSNSADGNNQPEPILEQTAGQVYAEFQNNEIAAEEKYNDGVRITGTVDGVGEDILSNPYVSLYSTNEFEYVQAMIAEQSQEMLSRLNSGQRLTVECQSVSTSLGSPFANSCVIVQ